METALLERREKPFSMNPTVYLRNTHGGDSVFHRLRIKRKYLIMTLLLLLGWFAILFMKRELKIRWTSLWCKVTGCFSVFSFLNVLISLMEISILAGGRICEEEVSIELHNCYSIIISQLFRKCLHAKILCTLS